MIARAFAAADERNLAFVDKLIQRMAQPGPPFTSEQHRQMNPFVFWCVVELRLPEAQLPSQAMRTAARTSPRTRCHMRAQQRVGSKTRSAVRCAGSGCRRRRTARGRQSHPQLCASRGEDRDRGRRAVPIRSSGAGAGKRPVGAKLLKRRPAGARMDRAWRAVLGVGRGLKGAGKPGGLRLRGAGGVLAQQAAAGARGGGGASSAARARGGDNRGIWRASVGQAGRVLPLPVQGRGRLQQGRRLQVRPPDTGGRGGAGAAGD